MKYGYKRVSTKGQKNDGNSLEAQDNALRMAGAEIIYGDAFTGMKKHRPELDKLMAALKKGDTLMVTKLDRIARSAKHGIELIEDLIGRGVTVHILNMGILDGTPTGKLMRTMLFAFAEFERDMIVQRTSEGKAIARQKDGYREGRKPVKYSEGLYHELADKVAKGIKTVSEAAQELGISRAKWYRLVKEIA